MTLVVQDRPEPEYAEYVRGLRKGVEIARARADALRRLAVEHRAEHDRRESKSVRAKYAAQARELDRFASELLCLIAQEEGGSS